MNGCALWALTNKSAAAYPCSRATQSQQSVVGKSTATSYTYPSHRLVPSIGIGCKSAVYSAISSQYIPATPSSPSFRACFSFPRESGLFRLLLRALSEHRRPTDYSASLPGYLYLLPASQQGGLDWSLTARIEGAHSDRAHSASERDHPGHP